MAPSIDWFHAHLAGKPYGPDMLVETRDNINFDDIANIDGGDQGKMDDLDVSALSFIDALGSDEGGLGSPIAKNPDEPDLASMTMAEQLQWNAKQLGNKPKRVIPPKEPVNPDEPDLASMTMAEQLAWNATQLGKKPKRVIGPPREKPESEMTLQEKL